MLTLAIVPEGPTADRLALVAIVAFGLATLTGFLYVLAEGSGHQLVPDESSTRDRWLWTAVTLLVVMLTVLVVKSWFRPGTTIGGGDLGLPVGSAWLGKIFDPWTWGGSTLGEPSQLPSMLPKAAVVALVRSLGGDAEIAQQIWYTTLFVGAGLAALALLWSLRLGPIPAFVGTTIYLLNPYVITWVNTYDDYIAALFLVAAIPAALIAAGTRRLRPGWSAILIASTAPLLGYAFQNPPLIGMVLAAMLATPLVVVWVEGKAAAVLSLRALVVASPLLAAASAYWMVPAIIHLGTLLPNQFASLAGWLWEEERATVRNGFWLNQHWAWPYPEYFPYAAAYDRLPLSGLKFLLPAVAFSSLALPLIAGNIRRLKLGIAAASGGMLVIVLSTGTNPPGSAVFDPLYNLPFGWLLREPSRFLMLTALAYAVMAATAIDALLAHGAVFRFITSFHFERQSIRLGVVPLAVGAMMLLGFPMVTGAFVPDSGPTLPSWAVHARPTHVQMPPYWSEMSQVADNVPLKGAVLVLPPDDFYEMPYTWYYGTDAFIVQSFHRRVLVPSSQGYTPGSAQLVSTVNLTAASILHKDWRLSEALVRALDAPLVLVRGDVASYAGRPILSPSSLADALDGAPNFTLVRRVGPLSLYALKTPVAEAKVVTNFVTTESASPDLRVLGLLPSETAIVSGPPVEGVADIVQAPPPEAWLSEAGAIVWRTDAQPGAQYELADLSSSRLIPMDQSGTLFVGAGSTPPIFSQSTSPDQTAALMAAQGVNVPITNGDFSKGPWGPVHDCRAAGSRVSGAYITAVVSMNGAPDGKPSLRLSASQDTACEYQSLSWRGGPLVLSVMVRRVQGSLPRICLWEHGPSRCAQVPAMPDIAGWFDYQARITPDAGTKSLDLFLYAEADTAGNLSVEDYAKVRLIEVPALPIYSVSYFPGAGVMVSVPSAPAIANGDFSAGAWGPVADCNASADAADAALSATVVQGRTPDGQPALRLSATKDSACTYQPLTWSGQSLLLSLTARSVEGAPPRICLWEDGPSRCASLPQIPETGGWVDFRASVTPDPGTKSLSLFLYADGAVRGGRTTTEYANVHVVEVPSTGFALLVTQKEAPPSAMELATLHDTFSSNWSGPAGSRHVLVDGMLNGWLLPVGSADFSPLYRPALAFRAGEWISTATAFGVAMLVSWQLFKEAGRRRRRVRHVLNS